MSDRVFSVLVAIYGIGWLIDWAYWIEVGWVTSSPDKINYVGPQIFGWVLAVFWPLHAISELWSWILN